MEHRIIRVETYNENYQQIEYFRIQHFKEVITGHRFIFWPVKEWKWLNGTHTLRNHYVSQISGVRIPSSVPWLYGYGNINDKLFDSYLDAKEFLERYIEAEKIRTTTEVIKIY